MDPEYLAYVSRQPALVGLSLVLPNWAAVAVVIGIFLAFLFIYVIVSARSRQRRPKIKKRPDFQGPALTGTAQVLAWIPHVGPRSTNYLTWHVYELPLRVEVPGRQPYEVSVTQRVPSWVMTAACRHPDMFVPVLVDSINPMNVWIDFDHPIG
jgi:hypothetical protein